MCTQAILLSLALSNTQKCLRGVHFSRVIVLESNGDELEYVTDSTADGWFISVNAREVIVYGTLCERR
jgi:hypothetical protein